MTFNFLNEKYKNVFSEEEFVNDYSYQKPENLKNQNFIILIEI